MIAQKTKHQWRCIGSTVQGASHVRTGLANQDAIHWQLPESGVGPPLILAVADGHGSPKSFRSHIGSRFAVETATKVIWNFLLENQSSPSNFSLTNDLMHKQLPQIFVQEWQQAVNDHYQTNPFTDEEWTRLIAKNDPKAQQLVEANFTLAYGATLLSVVVTESFILYFQLGDGDIVCVDANGKTMRPLPPDQRLIANETTSLCMPHAWKEARVRLVPSQENSLPAIILVSTDGYANSFCSEDHFLQIGWDYLQKLQAKGLNHVAEELPGFLKETSQRGSGDDITLGIIERLQKEDINLTKSLARRPLAMAEPIKFTQYSVNRTQKPNQEKKMELKQIITKQEKLIIGIICLQVGWLVASIVFTLTIPLSIWLLTNVSSSGSTGEELREDNTPQGNVKKTTEDNSDSSGNEG